MTGWTPSTLPGCFGHPCEVLRSGAHAARVWQASAITAYGVWCWQIDEGTVHSTRGNRGIAKGAAARALRAVAR